MTGTGPLMEPNPVRLRRLFVAGGLIALFGVILRLSARALAWPGEWTYSGDRAQTRWAFAEAAYIDLSLFALAFGLALILLGVWRHLR